MKEKKSPVLLELHEKPWDFFFLETCLLLVGVEK